MLMMQHKTQVKNIVTNLGQLLTVAQLNKLKIRVEDELGNTVQHKTNTTQRRSGVTNLVTYTS